MSETLTPSDQLRLAPYSENAYLQYALAVVKGRALASSRDGQKPVQLRILYAMHRLGLVADAKPLKSAKIVGDVLGDYHPHGDTAAYDAMVRMGQDFTLRYPLIAKQGNFGSRDGDPAAAMRYTEARLSAIADLLLSEINQGTVDFIPNYDGRLNEPTVLPARLPFLLLNGVKGVAVGMASDIPSHNLREVAAAVTAIIENPDITTAQLLELLPGPDFANGGQLISSKADILAAYEIGRGSLRTRARWRREELARGQFDVVVYELPYQVSCAMVAQEIAELTNPQIKKGAKALTQQQINLKQMALELLERGVDESSKTDPVRLVLSPRTSKVDPEALMAFLFANTSMEVTVSINMTHIGLDGRPQTKGLKGLLDDWVEFRFTTVRRRTTFSLSKALEQIHLLEGRLLAYQNLDAVVKTIREADDAKQALMDRFSLSEIQAKDILEMRLRQLNRLEGTKLEQDLKGLRSEAERLQVLLDSKSAMRKLIIKEIAADAAKFGDDRRTLIKPEARAVAVAAISRNVADEDVTVIISKNLWVRSRAGHDVDEASLTYKSGDERFVVLKTRSHAPVVVLDSKGRSYSVQASDIPPSRGDGVPLTTLIDIQDGAQVAYALSGNPDQVYLFAGEGGCGFVAQLKNLVATRKAGKAFLTLKETERPLPPLLVTASDEGYILVGCDAGRLLAFAPSEVKALANGGQGVMLMALEAGEKVTAIAYAQSAPVTLTVEGKGGPDTLTLKGDEWAKYVVRRARKGYQLPKKMVMRMA